MTAATENVVTRHHRDIWDRCAPTYVGGAEALTGSASTPLLDLAGVGRGTALLDVGTGPGALIGPALQRGARVVGIDLSPRMVDEARRRHPGAELVQGDAAATDFGDGSFDAATSSFCLQHVADPRAVLVEIHRVLRPGGRVAYAVWAPEKTLEAFGVGFEEVFSVVSLDLDPSLEAPPMVDTPEGNEQLLADAGFVHPTARRAELFWPMRDGDALFDLLDRYLDLSSQDEAVRDEVRTRIDRRVRERCDEDGIARLPNPAIVASAARP